MIKPPILLDEEERLETLLSLAVLDTLAETSSDDFAKLAAQMCQTPIAFVSLVAQDRQWFKAKVGTDVEQTHRDISFCAHAIAQNQLMIVPDATQDLRFKDNPLVVQSPHVRFYAGAPLVAPNGTIVGTLCVLDLRPRTLSQEQVQALQALARQTMEWLCQRESARKLINAQHRLDEQDTRLLEMARLSAIAEMSGTIAHEIKNPLAILDSKIRRLKAQIEEASPNLQEQLKLSTRFRKSASVWQKSSRACCWCHAKDQKIPLNP